MNPFQKQLIVGGKPLPFHADLWGQVDPSFYGPLEPPQRVSISEFEGDMQEINDDGN